MLVGGMDVSGNDKEGNHKFMGVVIGVDEKINSLFKDLDCDPLNPKNKYRVRDFLSPKIRFDCRNDIAFCVRIDRKRIISKVTKMSRIERKRIPGSKIYHIYHRLVMSRLREKMTVFISGHKDEELSKICFQCDSDCRNFVKDNTLRRDDKGNVYIVADTVALLNNHGRVEPPGVISMDISKWLEDRLIEKLDRM